MNRDPAKRITAFGIGVHKGEVRAVLVVNDAQTLVVASNGLTHSQAELLCDGCVDGLRECADLPSHLIDAFLDDQNAVELGSPALEASLDIEEVPSVTYLTRSGTPHPCRGRRAALYASRCHLESVSPLLIVRRKNWPSPSPQPTPRSW